MPSKILLHKRRNSAPCPRCQQLINLNSSRCIYCKLRFPRAYLSIPFLSDLIARRVSFVESILSACFVLYILALGIDITNNRLSGNILSLLSPSTDALYNLGIGGVIPWQERRWWTLLTATYLHGGILHIAFNMLWLKRIGILVEELFGASRFWIIYSFSGLVGSVISLLAGTYLFVGASGAIFGLFGALILYGYSRGGTFGSGLFRQMVVWVAIGLVLGFTMPGVDNWGHLGGLSGGLVGAWILGYQEQKRQSLLHHIGATIVMLGILVCFGFMVVFFFL